MAGDDPELAMHMLYDFVYELKVQTSVKVLITIDDVNRWDQLSDYMEPDNAKRRLDLRQLSMVDAFSTFCEEAPANGATVLTVSPKASLRRGKKYTSDADLDMLIQPYTDVELRHAIYHYNISGFNGHVVDDHYFSEVKVISGNFP